MTKKSNYVSSNRSKHYLKCHLIFVCKYHKKLLVDVLNNDMKAIMQSIASHSDFESEVFESDIDHIHFLIRYIPRLSVTSIARKLKQQSTIAIWQKLKDILSKNFGKEHTFWSDGYFLCSIGEACPHTVRQYILSQG
ncbi:MAG: IS200/IS605 family transposase [Candidatus Saccharimonadales bacterium]